MRKWMWMLGVLACLSLMLPGCGGRGGVDETKPLTELEAEAEEKDAEELLKMAEAYRDAVLELSEQIEDLQEDLEEIPPEEMLGEEAREVKARIAEVSTSADALVERFELYVKLAAKKGADTSGLKLK